MSHPSNVPVSVTGPVRDATFVDVFANQVRLSANVGDMMLVFGVVEDLGPGRFTAKDKAAIRLSMPTAKVLMQNLQSAIEAYESAVAVIPVVEAEENLRMMKESLTTVLRQALKAPERNDLLTKSRGKS